MTREEFIKVLDERGYTYEIVEGKIIITHTYVGSGAMMDDLTSLPPGVEFKNREYVFLSALTSLPPGVVFNNRGMVNLKSLTSISPGVEFKNKGDVYLESIIGGGLRKWSGNIEGIDSKRLLNFMIKQGVFER